ncbi:hypothetical protein [Methanosarcina acetivorans]|uniref:Uncharacterized protein n=1 Tax=Methanosarcina acetivorans (strain ATCC 35395 / DSM 2834 / JCM 12185 / C2A) TaxID=188937 RepID=Q8TTD7_METAC|nr:hypothetical protein [Methanosarcina acetivorans]AAM03944.1 predicted protein [Methanosarcina acetivorans C2A]
MKFSQLIATIICLSLALIAAGCTDSADTPSEANLTEETSSAEQPTEPQPTELPAPVPTTEQTAAQNESNFPSDKKEGYTLYIINNHGNINHEVTVELFDLKNSSIFNKSYILAPDEQIKSESSVGLADRTRIEVTLDNNTTENEVVLGDLSDVAILYIYIDAHRDDSLDLSIAVP